MKICKGLFFALMATAILIAACKGGNERNYAAVADSVRLDAKSASVNDVTLKDEDKAPVSSKAAEAKANDSIIRTAELKFKVKHVYPATTAIEDIATHYGGFVTTSNLTSSIDQVNTTEISADSSLETTLYTVTNNMVVRVPNTALDTTLKSMAYLIDYLDYRNIKAEDSRLQFLESQLTRNRLQHYNKRVENNIDTKGKKLTETTNAEDNLLSKQEQADNALLESYLLKDKVNFSTITLTIYQRQGIKREVISNTKNIEPYKPSLIKRFAESLQNGWIMIENVLLFLVSIWGFILLAIVLYIIYRKFIIKNKVQ